MTNVTIMKYKKKINKEEKSKYFDFFDIHNIFLLVCVTATISLQIKCLSHYFKDEDVSIVHYTKFYASKDDVYPSLSICILPPFLEDKFDSYEEGINLTSYVQFLKGDLWDERMIGVDYDNVTVSFAENLIYAYYVTQEETSHYWNLTQGDKVSFRSSGRKCFTIDAPIVEDHLLWYYGIYVKNDIFPEGKRSTKNRIFTYFHYPGQRFTSYYTVRTEWDSRINKTKSYSMDYDINNIDVITNRNKGKDRCIEEWKEYDKYIMDDIMKETGCHPSHWKPPTSLPLCTNETEMKNFALQPTTLKVEMYDPPCKIIERLDYTYKEKDDPREFSSYPNGFFHLRQEYLQVRFRDTVSTQEYTFDELVGNVGGYIGLFLGYALIQLPKLIMSLLHSLKKSIRKKRIHERYSMGKGKAESLQKDKRRK